MPTVWTTVPDVFTGFKIEPEQYSDILYFTGYVLGWFARKEEQAVRDTVQSGIMELACQPAEKELVDKHGLLPGAFMDKGGENYAERYQAEFNPLYDKYYDRLTDLAGFEYKQE